MKKNLQYDIVAFFAIFVFTIIFLFLFWNLPIHEDNGYYAFLSKAIASGAILHVDIPAQTNGIMLYFIAFVFKFTGSNIYAYKIVHLFFHFGLGIIIYLLLKSRVDWLYSLITSLLILLFLGLPSIAFDLGRNPIEIALFFVLLGLYFIDRWNNFFLFAFFLGLASLVRETFLIVPLITLLVLVRSYFISDSKLVYNFIFGLAVALSINAVILTYYNSWSGYLFDMLHSGSNFRYKDGFFSLVRLLGNLKMLIFGYGNYPLPTYLPSIAIGAFSYFLVFKDKTINYLKILFLIFVFEVIVINKTADYSILPLVLIGTILSVLTIKQLIRKYPSYVRGMLIIWLVFIANNFGTYYKYFTYAQNIASDKVRNIDPNRLVSIVNKIPHTTISAFSEYPLLFLSNVPYSIKYPYAEDLSAPYNLNRPEMKIAQLSKLKLNPPDVYVDKTTDWFLTKDTEIGQILDKNYFMIAKFDINKKDKFYRYKERILVSKKLLQNINKSTNYMIEAKKNIVIYSDKNQVFSVSSKCYKNLKLSNNEIKISFNSLLTNSKQLFIFAQKNTVVNVTNLSDKKCFIDVEILNFIQENL